MHKVSSPNKRWIWLICFHWYR